VDLIRAYLQHVSGRQRDENLVLASVAAWLERLAEMRNVALEHVRGGLRWRVAPQVVDQSVGGDDLVRVQQEQREHSPLLRAAERERSPIRGDLQRAQEAEFELFRASERSALGTSIQAHTNSRRGAGRSRPSRTSCRS